MYSLLIILIVCSGVSAVAPPPLGAIGTTDGWYLGEPYNLMMYQSPSNSWDITLVPSTNLYTISNGGIYLSAEFLDFGYNTVGGPEAQFDISLVSGNWIIYSPHSSSYLCASADTEPLCPTFCATAYSFTITPPTLIKGIKDAVSGKYIPQNMNYLSTALVQYTIAPVSGTTNTYTLKSGSWYLSAKNGARYNQEGPSVAYNQFQLIQANSQYLYIFSKYMYDYNTHGWLTSQWTIYGYTLSFANNASKTLWSLAP